MPQAGATENCTAGAIRSSVVRRYVSDDRSSVVGRRQNHVTAIVLSEIAVVPEGTRFRWGCCFARNYMWGLVADVAGATARDSRCYIALKLVR